MMKLENVLSDSWTVSSNAVSLPLLPHAIPFHLSPSSLHPTHPSPAHRRCTRKCQPVDLRITETTTYKSCRSTTHSAGFTEPSPSLKNQDTPSLPNNSTATTAHAKTAAPTWDPTLYDTPFHTDNFVLRTDGSAGSTSGCSPPPSRPAVPAAPAGATHEQLKSASSLRPTYFNDFDGNLGGGAGDEWIAAAMEKDSAESPRTPYARAGAGAEPALTTAMQGLRVSDKEEGEQGQQDGSTQSSPRVEDDRLVTASSDSFRSLCSVRC